jgi:hypothetical protein
MDLSALPATSEQLGKQTFLFKTPWAELSIFQRLKDCGISPLEIPPLGSVGLSAVFLALKISRAAVITAGLDFSFNMDSFHAKETPSWKDFRRKHYRLSGIIPFAAFRKGVSKTNAKNGSSVFTDMGLKNYRDLFEQEFSQEKRLRDINSTGLPLGIETVSVQEALQMLSGDKVFEKIEFDFAQSKEKSEKVTLFINDEYQTLRELRSFLSGEKESITENIEQLLRKADYLWSHFPEYAGTSRKVPDIHDLSFLKRVRTEIDPFINIFEKIRLF